MKSQKTIVCAILVLACVGGLSTRCLANNGISLTITGDDEIAGIGSGTYSASSKDGDVTSCSWSITEQHKDDETFTGPLASTRKQGEDCYVTFNSYGYIDLKCDAQVDVKGTSENASKTKRITCTRPPQNEVPTLSIVGDDEVTINSTHLYTANYSKTQGVPTITWSYPENHTHNGNYLNLSFLNLGTLHLNCALNYTDAAGQPQDPVPDFKDIKVLPLVNLTALRANYENSSLANIPGEEIVKIHYNIDDDDVSYDDDTKNKGADCLQTAFKENNTNPDDDLCKLEISFGNNINPNDITDGTLYIEVTKGLRLWRNNMRTNDNDIILGKDNKPEQIALSFSVPVEKTKIQNIINNGLYVEGLAPDYGYIKIRFGDKKLKLPYWAYAVGGPADQPDLVTRRKYKNKFKTIGQKKGLVDCEWCVVGFDQETRWDKFNCIAYAIDPNRTVFNTNNLINPFNGAFWVNPKLNPAIGFDNQKI